MSNGAEPAFELVKTLIDGGEKAFKIFQEISGGYWLDNAPEYFLTSHAATAIRDTQKKRTTALLEASVSETRSDAAAIPRGRPNTHDRPNGRYDIVLNWANGTPRAVVEVKSPLYYADIGRLMPDFLRLCKTLAASSESSFQFCAFLYYASVAEPERKFANASQRLRDMISRIDASATDVAQKHGLFAFPTTGSIHHGKEDSGAWAISCSIFVRPGAERNFI